MKTRFLKTAILSLLCLCFPARPVLADSSLLLADNVGRKITVIGTWSSLGKFGPFVRCRMYRDAQIYIETKQKGAEETSLAHLNDLYKKFKEGEQVKITARLHRQEPVEPLNETAAGAPGYFFFDVSEANIQHFGKNFRSADQ